MQEWPIGEIRRIERAYSPKFQRYGYFMLGSFIGNLPVVLQEIVDKNREDVLLVECTGKRPSKSGREYYTFKIVGKYSYDDLPEEYKDHRGQYPSKIFQGTWETRRDRFLVTGFPLRPWLEYEHPCTVEEFYKRRDEITKRRMRGICKR